MKLDELKGIEPTEEAVTTPAAPAEGDLVMAVPTGGFGDILSGDAVKEKVIVTDKADEPATMTSNAMVAEAMDTMDVALTGFNAELLQIKQKGEELRAEGNISDAELEKHAMNFNPNLDSEVENRQAEFVPGMTKPSAAPSIPQTSAPAAEERPEEVEPEEDDPNEFVPGQTFEPTPAPEPVPAEETEPEEKLEELPARDTVNPNFEMDERDFADLDDEEESEDEDDEESEEEFEARKQKYISEVKSLLNIIPENDVVDLSKMSISTKTMSASKAAGYTKIPTTTATHALLTSGRAITLTAFDGPEIASFDPSYLEQLKYITNRNYRGNARQTALTISTFAYYVSLLEMIYNHIVSPKPSTFNEWTKTIYWADVDDLIFAAYKATYGQVGNILSYECNNDKDKCKEVWPEIKNVEEMIEFSDDDPQWKERFDQIMHLNPDACLEPQRDLVQISAEYAVTMGAPTLEKIAEIAALDMDFANKYMDLISITQYIYEVYYIDKASNSLVPVKFKEYPDDTRKAAKSRLRDLGNIIKTSLTNDQREVLIKKTDDYDRPTDAIRYIYPSAICPKCKKKIEKMYADPSSMLFTRYQLVRLMNS